MKPLESFGLLFLSLMIPTLLIICLERRLQFAHQMQEFIILMVFTCLHRLKDKHYLIFWIIKFQRMILREHGSRLLTPLVVRYPSNSYETWCVDLDFKCVLSDILGLVDKNTHISCFGHGKF